MKLSVLQFGTVVGELESTADRGVVFRYSLEFVANPAAVAISQSLPIRSKEYSQPASRRARTNPHLRMNKGTFRSRIRSWSG